MKKNGILNPQLNRVISEMGHRDMLIIADAGLPIPKEVERIDLTLKCGIPSFAEVLPAVLSELKVRVPEDISIIGFDNIPFSDCTCPPLTTVAQPTYVMGQKAVEILIKLINKKKIKKSIELETELIERDSVSRWEV